MTNLLRLLRLKPRATESTAATKEKGLHLEPQQIRSQPRQPQQVAGSVGRRQSNPLLPSEGTSMGETNRRSGGQSSARNGAALPTDEDSYSSPSRNNNDSFQSLGSSSTASPGRFRYAQDAPMQAASSSSRGPYFPTEYADDDEDALAATIRPPNVPPPISVARRGGPQVDIPLPPPSAPPPSTARGPMISAPSASSSGKSFSQESRIATAKFPDVSSMLHSLGLSQYIADFRNEELLDMTLLCSMYQTERDFKEMLRSIGVAKLGHREMIAHAVKQHVEG